MTDVKCTEKGCKANKDGYCKKKEIQIDYFGGNYVCHSHSDLETYYEISGTNTVALGGY